MLKKISNRLFNRLFNGARLSYSQSGEDLMLSSILCGVKKGFYVDVGANNPFKQSNTHYFYKRGWNGINIDALPGSMNIFKKVRNKDINLEAGISDKEETLLYYMFEPSFYNTFSYESVEDSKKVAKYIGTKNIKTLKLSEIFNKYINTEIDFMTVDVEGKELSVLHSNDWGKYRPKVIILEHHAKDMPFIKDNEVYKTMMQNGYTLFCNTSTNMFYLENKFLQIRYEKNN